MPPAESTESPKAESAAGTIHRVGLTSLKSTRPAPTAEVLKRFHTKGSPLDQEGLERAWTEMLPKLPEELAKVREKLSDLKPELKDPDNFTLTVGNNFVEAEIRPALLPMLEQLRNLTERPLLNCHIEVVYEEKPALVYAPRDKYDVMLRENPTLDTFKVLFPDVDI